VQLEIVMNTERGQQARHQVTVQLDDVELCATAYQRIRQRALAWTDLYQVVCRLWMNCRGDVADNTLIAQEVLAEAFAGDVGGVFFTHRVRVVRLKRSCAGQIFHVFRVLIDLYP